METEHPNAALMRDFYDARARNDLEAVRSMLSANVVWREPDVGSEHTGDLYGPDPVLGMIREAEKLTRGTFRLTPCEIVANGEHAVAMTNWSAAREGERLEGKEVTVYRIRDGKVLEATFHQDGMNLDRRFWE
jgi:ketosteroid isomerase-like protein